MGLIEAFTPLRSLLVTPRALWGHRLQTVYGG